jgi:hypothetical protein
MSINRYKNGKIYAIRSDNSNKVYIGATCGELSKRLSKHKSQYKQWINGNKLFYYTSFVILELGNYYIELIENYPCESKNELHRREGEIIRDTDFTVNKHLVYLGPEEDRKKMRNKRNNTMAKERIININARVRIDRFISAILLEYGFEEHQKEELLGCSIESYRDYINNLLLQDMKWEDYGSKWCIQHIENVKQPGSTTEEIESRLHYMNTKPVWGSLGKCKSNK